MRMFFWLAVLGIVGYGVMQSPAVSIYQMEQKLGIERIGDWQVACIPYEPKCQAMLWVEKGRSTAKRAQGDFLDVKLRVFMTPDGSVSANVTYDREMPRVQPAGGPFAFAAQSNLKRFPKKDAAL